MTETKDDGDIRSLCEQYTKLKDSYKEASSNVNKLKEIKGDISEDNYSKYMDENIQNLKDIEPELEETKSILIKALESKITTKDSLEDEINELKVRVKENNRLFEIGVISKKELKHQNYKLERPLTEKKAKHIQVEKIVVMLKKALKGTSTINEEPLEDIPYNGSEGDDSGIFSLFLDDLQSGFRKIGFPDQFLRKSTNFIQRFFAFILLSQLLFLVSYIILRIEVSLNVDFSIIGSTYCVFILFGIILLILVLFKGVKAKAATFFVTSLIYFFLSLYLALITGAFKWYEFMWISFLGSWGIWNIIFSVIVLVIGIARTFIKGVSADYIQETT